MLRRRNFAADSRQDYQWRSSSVAVQIRPSSQDPLDVIVRLSSGGAGRINLLLSIMYGIPNTSIMLTPAMRIIGFLRRLIGLTGTIQD